MSEEVVQKKKTQTSTYGILWKIIHVRAGRKKKKSKGE